MCPLKLKTEEIVRGSSDAPVQKKLKKLILRELNKFPFYVYRYKGGTWNQYYIPLRNNLGDAVRKFGRIGHPVPSLKRKKAGLDYRYAMIINDSKYIELQTELKIPNSQYRCIKSDMESIVKEFQTYLKGYIKAVKKRRNEKEPLYRESSLINFIDQFDMDN